MPTDTEGEGYPRWGDIPPTPWNEPLPPPSPATGTDLPPDEDDEGEDSTFTNPALPGQGDGASY